MWSGFGIRRPAPRLVLGVAGAAVVAGLTVALFVTARADDPAALQMHRAVYDLSIGRVKTASEIDGLEGRMVVEWRGGPACDGYTSEQRVVTKSVDDNGKLLTSDVRLSSFEALDGSEYRFDRTEYMDGKLSAHETGHAYRKDGKAYVEEDGGAPQELPGNVLFPTAFNFGLIGAAERGKRVYSGVLFDGTQSTASNVTAFITGPEGTPPDAGKVRVGNLGSGDPLKGARSWRVHMSYFDGGGEEEDGTPSFEMGFAMFPNGVMSALSLDYDDVVMNGDLVQIDYFRPGSC